MLHPLKAVLFIERDILSVLIVLLLGGERNGSNMRRCRSSFLLPDGYFFRCR